MRILHELEKRADRHRLQALKKIEALEQEPAQAELEEGDQESRPDGLEKIQIRRSW
jgi:DNA anti-recombination protein RmuC